MPIKSVVFGPTGFAPSAMIVGDDHIDTGAYAVAPETPTGLGVDSDIIVQNQKGIWVSQIEISWAQVELNVDGTVCDDLAGYEIAWRVHDSGFWSPAGSVDPLLTSAHLAGLPLNTLIDLRVRARDTSGNASGWDEIDGHLTSQDTIPPNPPSAPTVTSLFGAFRVGWDGKDNAGAAMPGDFSHITVHQSTDPAFVPSASNQVDVISDPNGGASLVPATDYGIPHYVLFLAYDTSGNVSGVSPLSPAVVSRQGVDADFQNVSATKLIAGRLTATVGIDTGKLQIGVLDANGNLVNPTGARIIVDSSGFKAYDANNVNTVAINNDGSATFRGTVTASQITGSTISGGTISGATFLAGGIGTGIVTGGVFQNSTNICYDNSDGSYYESGTGYTNYPAQWYMVDGGLTYYDSAYLTSVAVTGAPSGATHAVQASFPGAVAHPTIYNALTYRFRDDAQNVFLKGVTYTLSFDVKLVSGEGTGWFVNFAAPAAVTTGNYMDVQPNIGQINAPFTAYSTGWTRYSFTFTPDFTWSQGVANPNWILSGDAFPNIELYFENYDANLPATVLQVTGVQIELGPNATQWSNPPIFDMAVIDGGGNVIANSVSVTGELDFPTAAGDTNYYETKLDYRGLQILCAVADKNYPPTIWGMNSEHGKIIMSATRQGISGSEVTVYQATADSVYHIVLGGTGGDMGAYHYGSHISAYGPHLIAPGSLSPSGVPDAVALSAVNHPLLRIGDPAALNLQVDGSQIQATSNGAAGTLKLNPLGGDVTIAGQSAPRGFVGMATNTGGTGQTAGATVCSTTVSLVSGRKYRVTSGAYGTNFATVGVRMQVNNTLTNATGLTAAAYYHIGTTSGNYDGFNFSTVFTATATGNATLAMTYSMSSSTASILGNAANPISIWIEDIGT